MMSAVMQEAKVIWFWSRICQLFFSFRPFSLCPQCLQKTAPARSAGAELAVNVGRCCIGAAICNRRASAKRRRDLHKRQQFCQGVNLGEYKTAQDDQI